MKTTRTRIFIDRENLKMCVIDSTRTKTRKRNYTIAKSVSAYGFETAVKYFVEDYNVDEVVYCDLV